MSNELTIQKSLKDFQITKAEYGKPDDGIHGVDIGELYYWACKLESYLVATMQREAKLREALGFYADFEENTDDGQYQYYESGDPGNMMTLDEGEKARAALASCEYRDNDAKP